MTRLLIAAPYVALWLVVVAAYPTLRGDPLLWLYTAAELAGGLFVVGCLLSRRPRLSAPVACTVLLTSASLATTTLPALAGPRQLAGWDVVQTVWLVALACVVGLLGLEVAR